MALPTSAIGGSQNTSTSAQRATSNSITYGSQATNASIAAAQAANQQAFSNWQSAANFNAEEAAKQRAWLEQMANTVYQRTVKDMQAAGINPVLAAGMGLGTASVSGGGAASVNSPNTYMSTAYPDSTSSSESIGNSQAQGSSWNHSGFEIFLDSMASIVKGLTDSFTSGQTINIGLQGLDALLNDKDLQPKDYDNNGNKGGTSDSVEGLKQVVKGTESFGNWLLDAINPFNTPLVNTLKDNYNNRQKDKETAGKKNIFNVN